MNKRDFLHYILNCYVTITRDRPDTRLGFCTYIDISRISKACYAFITGLSDVNLGVVIERSLYRCEQYSDIVRYVRRTNDNEPIIRAIYLSSSMMIFYEQSHNDEPFLVYRALNPYCQFYVNEDIVDIHTKTDHNCISLKDFFEVYKNQKILFENFFVLSK
jgi:hypothetical protein